MSVDQSIQYPSYWTPDGSGLIPVDPNSAEWQEIVHDIGQFDGEILNMSRVQNRCVYNEFFLRKKGEKSERLFHGTSTENVNSICDNNFDPLRAESSNRHGLGVNFSPCAWYASYYPITQEDPRVIIVAEVWIGAVMYSDVQVASLPEGYDTVIGNDAKVIVKFRKEEFYPHYVVEYTSDRIREYYNSKFQEQLSIQ